MDMAMDTGMRQSKNCNRFDRRINFLPFIG